MNRDWHDKSLNELAAAIFANLSGDGDGHGEGTRVEVDHAIPSHPVIRIRTDRTSGESGGGGAGGPGLQPWTFRCTINPGENGGEETREGGWLMPRLQFGYDLVGEYTDPRLGTRSFTAEELAQTDDGDYYIKCDSNNETFSLVRQPLDSSTRLYNDYRNGIVYFFVGTVSGGVQTVAPHMIPVFYYNV